MALNLRDLKRRAKEYIEQQGHMTVKSVRFARRFTLFGREDVALEVHTTDKKDPIWWVIGGSTPMNLYSRKSFPEVDVAHTLHTGLVLRVQDREYKESRTAPDDIGYDAFISHASEDKEMLVKPLAAALARLDFRVWYDEFELTVGDSLRQSIDRGLATSRYGIVVLSNAFFSKNWPQYELNGLVAREMDGRKVILPIWHGVEKEDVLRFSPPLADKVALTSSRMSVRGMAKELAKVLSE
jgi:hypothetical protein